MNELAQAQAVAKHKADVAEVVRLQSLQDYLTRQLGIVSRALAAATLELIADTTPQLIAAA